ncbi:MAG: alpha-E domain-containing protein [Cytophagaceae bacterium]|jgi:uncharacterized alpha-E superfamily protein|nr:alpha-E domain-containing protein [Cytophagaceae bacterium]
MLARIANNLFWMARYLERSEHITRYAQVHYFSSIDAPLSIKRESVLESVLQMAGAYTDYVNKHDELEETQVVKFIGLDDLNPISVRYSISRARENARGARDSISTELWETINTYYHYTNSIQAEDIAEQGMYEYTHRILQYSSIVNGYIDQSLLRDETWSIIHLGQHIERAVQIMRMIVTKLMDLNRIPNNHWASTLQLFEIVNLLKSTETYDMSKIFYKDVPNATYTLAFLTLNAQCPKSIVYNLQQIKDCIDFISDDKNVKEGSLEFQANKMLATLSFTTIEEVAKNPLAFYYECLNQLYKLSDLLEKKYLTY